jgi:hypothetical protein
VSQFAARLSKFCLVIQCAVSDWKSSLSCVSIIVPLSYNSSLRFLVNLSSLSVALQSLSFYDNTLLLTNKCSDRCYQY